MLWTRQLSAASSRHQQHAGVFRRHRRLGAIAVGIEADLVVLGVPNFACFLYEVGHYPVQKVIKNGLVVVDVDAELAGATKASYTVATSGSS